MAGLIGSKSIIAEIRDLRHVAEHNTVRRQCRADGVESGQLRARLRIERPFDLAAQSRRAAGSGPPTRTSGQSLVDRVQAQACIAPHRQVRRVVIREFIRIDVDANQPAADRQSQRRVNIGLAHFGAHRHHHIGLGDQGLNRAVGKRSTEVGGMIMRQQTFAGRGRHQRAVEGLDQALQFASSAARAAAGDDDGPGGEIEQANRCADSFDRGLGQRRRIGETISRQRGGFGQHVERDFQVRRTGAPGAQRGQTDAQMIAYVLGARGRSRHPEDSGGKRRLTMQFVQHAPLLAERGAHRRGRDYQERDGIGVGLCNRGQNIGQTRAGNGEGGGGAAAHARIAIGCEAGTLLVAHQHVPQIRGGEPAVEFQIVDAGNSKHGIDAIGDQQFDEIATDTA